ncbi:MAG: stage II sporulation protein M, partial [Ruminococcus sp.]
IENGGMGAFCGSFCSNFLFYLLTFLFGLSLWGIAFLPFLSFFKGFGIGVSAGYLFTSYGFTGVVFYLTILLPGIFLFSMVLVYMSTSSYNISKRILKFLFSKEDFSIISSFKIYFKKCLLYLLITFFSALLDMSLWYVFAGLFNFN